MKKPSLKKIDLATKYWNSWPMGMRNQQYEYLDALHYAATEYLKLRKNK